MSKIADRKTLRTAFDQVLGHLTDATAHRPKGRSNATTSIVGNFHGCRVLVQNYGSFFNVTFAPGSIGLAPWSNETAHGDKGLIEASISLIESEAELAGGTAVPGADCRAVGKIVARIHLIAPKSRTQVREVGYVRVTGMSLLPLLMAFIEETTEGERAAGDTFSAAWETCKVI